MSVLEGSTLSVYFPLLLLVQVVGDNGELGVVALRVFLGHNRRVLLVNRVLAYRGVLAGSWVLFLHQLPDLLEFCDHVEALLFSLELGLSGEVHLEL